jgi:dipeptidyl aminopeptidase/acylaminoacyl peptidase
MTESCARRVDFPFADVSGEVIAVDWSDDARRLLLMQVSEAVQRLATYDIERGTFDWLDHPSGMIYSAHFAPDGEIFVLLSDSIRPSRVLALDGTTGAEKRVLLQGEEAPAGVKWRSISYPSTEGATIQAWLATPPGDPPYPTILEIHGGPTAATFEYFSPRVQAWLDHGWAVLSINYRGSTTFGREFQNCIRGHLGDWEVDDMGAAHEWLVAEGIAKPDQVFLQGGSYGGYLTLLGLGRLPDRWSGGMAMVAIADWVLMYEDQAETLRRYQVGLFGGTPEEKPEQHAKSSPITYATDVRVPLLVIQGKNDTRCPSRQMESYHEKMLELGKDIDLRWFEAGHGSYAIEQNIEHMGWMLEFAHDVLARSAAAPK